VVAGSSIEGIITVSEVATGKQLTKRSVDEPGKQLTAFAASADGKTVVTGSAGGLVKVWDVTALRGQAK
jgi:WD40 repeat protein